MSRPLRIAARLLAGAMALGVGWLAYRWAGERGLLPSGLSPNRGLLVLATAGERPSEARLTGGFRHAPLGRRAPATGTASGGATPAPSSTAPRGPSDRARPDFPSKPSMALAAKAIEAAVEVSDSATARADLGALQLAARQPALAVRWLESAAAAAPDDALISSDLAAAYLAQADAGEEDALSLVRALGAADRAVAAEPSLPEARFNLALALERLFLLEPARAAWNDYLGLDSTSAWADEAREHLTELAGPTATAVWNDQRGRLLAAAAAGDETTVGEVVAAFPQEARHEVEEQVLPAWGDHVLKGENDDAAASLSVSRVIAAALASRGEHMPGDAVAAIDQALAAGDEGRVRSLAVGHKAYGDARVLYRGSRDEATAEELFRQAQQELTAGGSPAAALAQLFLAIRDYNRGDDAANLAKLSPLVDEATAAGYPGLLGRVLWMRGMSLLRSGFPSDSLATYLDALAVLQQAGTVEDLAAIESLIVENLSYLGQEEEMWRHLYRQLYLAPRLHDARRFDNALETTADRCEEAGEMAAALAMRQEAVRVEREAGDRVGLPSALLKSAGDLHRLGRDDEARDALEQASAVLPLIDDAVQRGRVEADLLAIQAELELASDPAAAAASLARVAAFYQPKGNLFVSTRMDLASARAAQAVGEPAEAAERLRRGISTVEAQRLRILGEPLKIGFFDRSRDLFDDLVRLEATSLSDPGQAFEDDERGRSQSLLDRLGSRQEGGPAVFGRNERERIAADSARTLSAAAVRGELPSHTVLVEYAALPDELVTWVIAGGGVSTSVAPTGAARLDELAEALRGEVRAGADLAAPGSAAIALYDLLIRPALPALAPGDRLVLVPDRALHRVPFAALVDRATRRHLFEDHALVVDPSATFYVEALRRRRELEAGGPDGGALVVGDPAFDANRHRDLSPLPGAADEAAAIAGLLGGEPLTGGAATKRAFLAAAPASSIIHFGGHAVVNPKLPLLSYLLLAPDGDGGPGELYAHELYGLALDRTRLVVLAACSSASGRVTGEGLLSLARPFLAAGVPTVVASLWSVEDRPTNALFDAFYQALAAGAPPTDALRQAQLALLHDPDPALRSPTHWAAFELLGAGGE